MSFLRRKHYTVFEAAKAFDVDIAEVQHQLTQGVIRRAYWLKSPVIAHRFQFTGGLLRVKDLTPREEDCLFRWAADGKSEDEIASHFKSFGIKGLAPDRTLDPEYLYLQTTLKRAGTKKIAAGFEFQFMELLNRDLVINVGPSGYPQYFRLYPLMWERRFDVDCLITLEELNTYGVGESERERGTHLESSLRVSETLASDNKPFFNKAEADEFTRVINHFGNEYYERNKKIPNPGQLISFVQECINEGAIPNQWAALTKKGQPNTLALSISSSQKKIVVGERSLIKESIKDRIKNSTKAWKARNKNL